jgi:hypothetical protein
MLKHREQASRFIGELLQEPSAYADTRCPTASLYQVCTTNFTVTQTPPLIPTLTLRGRGFPADELDHHRFPHRWGGWGTGLTQTVRHTFNRTRHRHRNQYPQQTGQFRPQQQGQHNPHRI